MQSEVTEPINLGSSNSSRSTSSSTSSRTSRGFKLQRDYDLDAPKGVNGRNSDNTLILKRLGWEPCDVRSKMAWRRPIRWIYEQMVSGAEDAAALTFAGT